MMTSLATNRESPPDRHPERAVREDWEDWEEDEAVSPLEDGDGQLLDTIPESPSEPRTKSIKTASGSAARQPVQRISRLKSRRRQQAQNAKAGIKLVTDMSKFGRQHIAHQMKNAGIAAGPSQGKFVDAAALKALEGEPSTATMGSFHWLRKKQSQTSKKNMAVPSAVSTPLEQDLSPNNKIVIGFALPPGAEHIISPQTAVVATPVEFPVFPKVLQPATHQVSTRVPVVQQQRSAWSPDTEYGQSPSRTSLAASSIYSQHSAMAQNADVPPVPEIPRGHKNRRRTTIIMDDEEDAHTPVTLFEEDGSPLATRKSFRSNGKTLSPSATGTLTQGWWDEVTSPFAPSPVSAITASPGDEQPVNGAGGEWWKDADEKRPQISKKTPSLSISPPSLRERGSAPTVVIEVPSPTAASSSSSGQTSKTEEVVFEKSHVKVTQAQLPSGSPPPYSPPDRQNAVRYRAVFPTGHPLQAMYPPSPGPVSPALAGTMTSQGAISMTDVPLTPPPRTTTMGSSNAPLPPLPDRPLGSFVPGDHFLAATGRGQRQKAEKRRRRNEKEDMIARKFGGLWKGRGCMPANGCYGRSGREGRKKRRICIGACVGSLVLLILIIVLAVTLSHRPSGDSAPFNQWLNLTNFPPIPTGVTTVVGSDNSDTTTACVQPSTLWSCSLPKEQAASVAPSLANQPGFIFQIQFDNNTNQRWNVPDEEPPHTSTQGPRRRRLRSVEAGAQVRRGLFDPGFAPNPSPPAFFEMFFLGNTTDGIQADRKAGEPTPFYISLLRSLNETIGPNMLTRRGLFDLNTTNLPMPDLNPNGTGAPARLLPFPVQQPLRLYDRGLPTEHYGFYSYFNKTIYVKSVEPLDKTTAGQGEVPADQNGGSLETEAGFLVIWAMTRFKVEIWTRRNSTALLLGPRTQARDNTTRPGTMPYPVTVTLDTHGGDYQKKGTVAYAVDARQQVNTTDFQLVVNNIGFNGERINPGQAADLSLGGIDGGTSGCNCAYQNFVRQNGR